MSPHDAVERALQRSFSEVTGPATPPRLRAAMRHAVFAGGGRVRPRLVLQTVDACGAPQSRTAETAAVAVELLHCASLVHDDLPCFDDAPTRRGRPSVHAAFGEEMAVLTGDALIVAAFATLGAMAEARLVPPLLEVLTTGAGAIRGLVAGQAWESEPVRDLHRYHRAKTAALFEASVRAGAIVAGSDPAGWAAVGTLIGQAYQVADDIVDVVGSPEAAGKPVGQDNRRFRPSAVVDLGLPGALGTMRELVARTVRAVPTCPRRERFTAFLCAMAARLERAASPSPEERTLASAAPTMLVGAGA